MTNELKLPPLPVDNYVDKDGLWDERYGPYDADDMCAYALQAQKDALLWAAEFCASNVAAIPTTGPHDDFNVGRRAESRSLAILLRQLAEGMK